MNAAQTIPSKQPQPHLAINGDPETGVGNYIACLDSTVQRKAKQLLEQSNVTIAKSP